MFRTPPPHSNRFRSDHLDEIEAFIATYDGHHRRSAMGTGPLGFSVHAVRCGEVDLGWGQTRVRQNVRGIPQSSILHVPLVRRHIYTVGRRTLEARPDTAILLGAGQEYTFHFEPDDTVVMMRIPDAALTAELLHRDPSLARRSGITREIPLADGRLGALAALHGTLVDATTPTTGSSGMALRRQLEARVCSWVADQVLGTRPAKSTRVLGVLRMRIVEEWIEAHLADPITLGRLCAVAGIGDRYLESSFRSHRGQTPMQFVSSRRLASVRRSLLESKQGDSVTQLAHQAGLVHLGRFAARYRATYSESPSATLRRNLQFS